MGSVGDGTYQEDLLAKFTGRPQPGFGFVGNLNLVLEAMQAANVEVSQ